MVDEEKTIDGFSVRRAGDSKLVSRSKANKLSSNKVVRRVKTVTANDPLVKKSTKGSEVLPRTATSMDMKSTKKLPKARKISRAKTAEMFVAEP